MTGADYGVAHQSYLKELFDSLHSGGVVIRDVNRLVLQWARGSLRHSILSI